jgi:hypothetical protein
LFFHQGVFWDNLTCRNLFPSHGYCATNTQKTAALETTVDQLNIQSFWRLKVIRDSVVFLRKRSLVAVSSLRFRDSTFCTVVLCTFHRRGGKADSDCSIFGIDGGASPA